MHTKHAKNVVPCKKAALSGLSEDGYLGIFLAIFLFAVDKSHKGGEKLQVKRLFFVVVVVDNGRFST